MLRKYLIIIDKNKIFFFLIIHYGLWPTELFSTLWWAKLFTDFKSSIYLDIKMHNLIIKDISSFVSNAGSQWSITNYKKLDWSTCMNLSIMWSKVVMDEWLFEQL